MGASFLKFSKFASSIFFAVFFFSVSITLEFTGSLALFIKARIFTVTFSVAEPQGPDFHTLMRIRVLPFTMM